MAEEILHPSDPTRRDVLKMGALVAAAPLAGLVPRASRRVIVAGGGIGGLCCGYELMRRGHDVIVLEASDRTGGHVYTHRDGLDDGLYVDGGAEHFTKPGYERYWQYVEEFQLPYLYYPRREHLLRWLDGRMHTEQMLRDPAVLQGMGFNAREVAFLRESPFPELPSLYYKPYADQFADEYKPFDAKLDHLDAITLTDLLKKEGASPRAIAMYGGRHSALQNVWYAAILKKRGVPLFPPKVYRLKGGNQRLPDTFAARLGDRVRLKSPVTKIEHSPTGVRVHCRGENGPVQHDGDFLVCAMSAVMLSQIEVSPAWSAEKAYAIHNVPYYFDSRPIFQTKSRFWQKDGISPNMEFGDRTLYHAWATGDDVETTRGLLVGTCQGAGSIDAAVKTYRKFYPGKSEDIERTAIVTWATNPWASACERTDYEPGQLRKFWPTLIEPVGRVHFVGAYADNLNWGMEAATRSANRVAEAIHSTT
ncbi:MAG TPA: NAD(P)/FAD-dependent oxidoreductase [Vicinamibacterales bacterium]|nr:NAD(P)/FAD-dependent oxidoreductase [Vicinamibacterales bacterium]